MTSRKDKEGVCYLRIAAQEQLRCMELFYGVGNWLGESLWVSISGEASKGQHPPRARTVHPDIQEDK